MASPSRVKMAAARIEQGSSAEQDTVFFSSSSAHSQPVSSSPKQPSQSPQNTSARHHQHGETLLIRSSSPKDPNIEGENSLSEVTLSASEGEGTDSVVLAASTSYTISPPALLPNSAIYAESSSSATSEDDKRAQPGIISTALSIASPASSSPVPDPATSSLPSGSTPVQPGGGWMSTVNNLFTSRSPAGNVSPASGTASSLPSATSPAGPSRKPSTSFLLHRLSSTTASHDRRISREMGGGEKLREGFERVRGEMEVAAKEMRRERLATTESTSDMPTAANIPVDWDFWGAVVSDYEEVAMSKPKELSKAIQQGIPPVIRGAIWQLMSSSKDTMLEETYKGLLKMNSSHEKAIAKDLSRTFPNHKFFQDDGGVGQESLFMVVKAYSLYDEDVGYTQGLAFIVAALLLNMPDEEAFCVLVRLMNSYNLRSHYLADMPGLQLRLYQFERLLEEILPLLHTHFVRKGVKSSMFASQWFMTLFSYRFPLSLVYRVLDIVFAEGVEAIFRFSLALLQQSEGELLKLDFEQILHFLQGDLFEVYRANDVTSGESLNSEEQWRANDFVRDAYGIRIAPFMLDSYESEYDERCRVQNKHALELDQLRNANRNLSMQVNQLEASLAAINQEHVELVRQLVLSKIEREETANELVRVKLQYAELAHAQQDAMSIHSRFSNGSLGASGGKS